MTRHTPKTPDRQPTGGLHPESVESGSANALPDSFANPVLSRAVDRALAAPPMPSVPPGFAERVARLAAQQPRPARLPWLGWGPRLALLSGLVLTIALFVVAPHTAPTFTDLRFDTELLLLAELSGLLLFAPRLIPGR